MVVVLIIVATTAAATAMTGRGELRPSSIGIMHAHIYALER